MIEIIVADNESGPAGEALRQAFDSNFSTKRLGQVERFVQESGSSIEIKSKVSIGTAVRMLLPVSRPGDGNSADLSNSIATF